MKTFSFFRRAILCCLFLSFYFSQSQINLIDNETLSTESDRKIFDKSEQIETKSGGNIVGYLYITKDAIVFDGKDILTSNVANKKERKKERIAVNRTLDKSKTSSKHFVPKSINKPAYVFKSDNDSNLFGVSFFVNKNIASFSTNYTTKGALGPNFEFVPHHLITDKNVASLFCTDINLLENKVSFSIRPPPIFLISYSIFDKLDFTI